MTKKFINDDEKQDWIEILKWFIVAYKLGKKKIQFSKLNWSYYMPAKRDWLLFKILKLVKYELSYKLLRVYIFLEK